MRLCSEWGQGAMRRDVVERRECGQIDSLHLSVSRSGRKVCSSSSMYLTGTHVIAYLSWTRSRLCYRRGDWLLMVKARGRIGSRRERRITSPVSFGGEELEGYISDFWSKVSVHAGKGQLAYN